MVAIITHYNIATLINGNAVRTAERGERAPAVGVPHSPAPCERAHNATGRHYADTVVTEVRNDHEAVTRVHGHAARTIERSACAGAVGKRARPAPRERGHHTARCDFADAVVAAVRDNDVAAAFHGHAGRATERSACAGAVGKRARPAPSERGHHTARCDCADAVVAGVRDNHVAGRIDCYALRGVERSARTGAVGKAGSTAPRKRTHQAPRGHFADAIIEWIRNENITPRVDGHTGRIIEPSARAGSVGEPRQPAPRKRSYNSGKWL
jgi:hypothetical protein